MLADPQTRELLWRPDGSVHTPAYHSRYTLPHRKALDAGVLAAYGRGGTGGSGRILVATQVAEQSLDVDFDLMVTDLCPIDVLLQRLGRVWRHRERDESRPRERSAVQAWVIEPEDGLEPLIAKKFGGENGWGTVYKHLGFLELTRRTIQERGSVEVPRENRVLIEAVYHSDHHNRLRRESAGWEEHFQKQEGESLGHELTAKGVVVRFEDTYIANADRFSRDIAGPVRTRLGDDRVRVLLPAPLVGYYDPHTAADSVDIPWKELQKAKVPSDLLAEPRATGGHEEGGCYQFALSGFRFWYGPLGWEWGDE